MITMQWPERVWVAVVEPSFWLGPARTSVGTYIDYLNHLRFREDPSRPIRNTALLLHRPESRGSQQRSIGRVLEVLPSSQ
jgi:hypothetical protein